jgi:hypothetical protein
MIKNAIATVALIGLGLWAFLASFYAPIQVQALDHWLRNIVLPLTLIGLIYGAFRLGMYHALEVPLRRLAIGLGILGIAVAGLWYLLGPWVGMSLSITLVVYAVVGDRFKESELREQADEEDSNGGWAP